jgi:flagellar hook-associated protein 3 FlgL
MRIADKMNFDQVKNNLTKNRTEMASLQNQAATQKKVTKPSDDPLAATRVLASKTDINVNQQFLKSVSQARAFLEYSDQSLGELSEILMRAKELALSQSNDASASADTRRVTAAEIEQLYSQAVQVGNRKLGDRFLFGGFKTTQPPFDSNGKYSGDDGEIRIAINKEANVAMNIPGGRVFLGQNLKNDAAFAAGGADSEPQLEGEEGHLPEAGSQPVVRGPASVAAMRAVSKPAGEGGEQEAATGPQVSATWKNGINLFKVLEHLETGLRANDKESVQESIDRLDQALAQVILSRSQLGSRVGTLNSAAESLQKSQVDSKGLVSNLEDADTFELVSDLNKTESTLKASLATSGKLIQPSLLDFLR